MQNNPKVAIVIVHWNRRQLLEQFLPSVMQTTYGNMEVVVADNCSDDDSVQFLQTHYPSVHIVSNDKNYGYAGGYNHALQQVEADYYVLLNNDIEVTPGWLEPIVEVMKSNPKLAAVQPKVLDYHSRNKFEYAGAGGGYIDTFGYAFCRGRLFESLETDDNQYNNATTVFWATGACMVVKAAVFKQLKGFDEQFFAHMEEIDLCWRMQLAGYQLMVVPQSTVYHVGGGTLNKQSPQKTYLNFRNNLIMLTKNLPVSTLCWLIPVRSVLDLLGSIFFMMNGLPKYSLAVHKAHVHYFFQFGKWWGLRKQNASFKPLSSLKGVYRGSVVWEHFIKKVKYYSELDSSKLLK
ncbi:MAG: glycosyltransferase family 2 protein [Bacteroidetes bacterium]|nr:MAG: glycosyltransferase family 2 protein [Bacteroidota bacterium]